MRILAVGAHPDDIEILCAGTLLRYRQEGHELVMAIATNGEQGHFEIVPEELAPIRRKEAEASAAIAGAELIWMNFPDQFLYHDDPTRRTFVNMVRQADPHIVITHNPADYSQDHRVVAELMFTATFMAGVPHLETGAPPLTRIPPLYYMDHITGTGFQPEELVDITSVFEQKVAMLECHQSQLTWLKEHDGVDIVDMMRTVARFRALSCPTGVTYAEGYRRLDAWGRNPVSRLLP